ncbi:hypothetical protein [Bacillus sp. RAR_GA_16]|uniref:hypothetical protein n=1 Tax=Bacillus sp. RAR_GA_16 TaxID=2876774 RepID=UPI001CC9105B|nr:hypothetical protein [Bacillus sp. RAR_GA_16]MCA0172592.1 hypothetical protein [Bacillus sp. RAR_GA_16]
MNREKLLFILLVILLLSGCGNAIEKVDSSTENREQKTSEVDFNRQVEMMANDEKIIEMLKESGEIPKDASPTEIQKALEDYLKEKSNDVKANQKSSEKYIEELKKQIESDLQNEKE